MGINKAPYPPIVDSWTQTTVIGENIRINFSLSAYSNITDIRTDAILVDIVNSENNESVINYAANQGCPHLITNLQIDENNKYASNGKIYWKCQCDCGKIKSIKSSSLRRGEITSCGCYRTEQQIKSKIINGTIDNLIG